MSRFAALFRGSPRGHGRYEVAPSGQNGQKIEGQRWFAKEPLTDKLIGLHLSGQTGVGAVPLLLDPPGTTVWAAIDVDDYLLDLPVFVALVVSLGLPAVVCRTKSGGAHVYVFFSEPVATRIILGAFRLWSRALGYPNAEIFPKQLALGDDKASESYWGNWINLPYQGGDRSTRYAFSDNGASLSLDAFLDLAEERKVTQAQLAEFKLPPAAPDSRFPGAPPCLIAMAAAKVTSGGRNQALFTAALYYKKRDKITCENETQAYNLAYLVPPLLNAEAISVVKAANKKDFNYRCHEFPMASVCDRSTCEQVEFGVRHGRSELSQDLSLALGRLIKIMTQPPLWRWEINGEWVELSTDEFMTQRLFLKRVLEVTNARTRPVRPRTWEGIIDAAVSTCVIEVPPPDATAAGQLMFHLGRFCTSRAQAKTRDEMLLGKPFTDSELHRTFFVVSDLLAYLGQQRVTGLSERTVYAHLRDHDLQSHGDILKGKYVLCWSVPEQALQTQEFDPPREDVAPL